MHSYLGVIIGHFKPTKFRIARDWALYCVRRCSSTHPTLSFKHCYRNCKVSLAQSKLLFGYELTPCISMSWWGLQHKRQREILRTTYKANSFLCGHLQSLLYVHFRYRQQLDSAILYFLTPFFKQFSRHTSLSRTEWGWVLHKM